MTTANRHDPDPGSFRTKCQRWGVVYVFDANKPQPPPGGTTPPPTTPPRRIREPPSDHPASESLDRAQLGKFFGRALRGASAGVRQVRAHS